MFILYIYIHSCQVMILSTYNKKPTPNEVGLGRWKIRVPVLESALLANCGRSQRLPKMLYYMPLKRLGKHAPCGRLPPNAVMRGPKVGSETGMGRSCQGGGNNCAIGETLRPRPLSTAEPTLTELIFHKWSVPVSIYSSTPRSLSSSRT